MLRTIKEIRAEKGFSQKEVADLLKISVEYYNRIENGKRKTTLKLKTQISKILSCTNADIIDQL